MSEKGKSAVPLLRPSASASAFGSGSSQAAPSGLPAATQQSLSSSRDPQLLRPPSRSASTSVIGDRIVAPPQPQHSSGSSLGGSSLFSGFLGFGQRGASAQVTGEHLPKPLPKGGFGPIGSRPRTSSGQLPSQQSSQQYTSLQFSQQEAVASGMSSMSSWGSEQNSSQPDLALNGRQGSDSSGEHSMFTNP